WQKGFGCFSYSKSHVPRVCNYIHNQYEHHKKRSFKKEYFSILKQQEVEYKEQYLFEWYDDEGEE
ncbi:MAG: transposase, partial [Marinilabiliales bacterium]